MKVCIYTVIFGDYDQVHEHVQQDINCDYICFTDNPALKSNLYRVILYEPLEHSNYQVPSAHRNIVNTVLFRSNLFLIEPLKSYDICIYIDANAQIIDQTLISSILSKADKNCDMIIPVHSWRKNIYDEIVVSTRISKYNNTNFSQMTSDYQADGFDGQGLLWNGFVIYLKPFAEHMRSFYQLYSEQFMKYAIDNSKPFHPQGQVILPYVLWKTGVRCFSIEDLYCSSRVNVYRHKTKNELADFDWRAYIAKYPDLRAAKINTADAALRHYYFHGRHEGRHS